MGVILSRSIQGLHKCILLIILILFTIISLLNKRSAPIMLAYNIIESAAALHDHQLNYQKPQGYSSSASSFPIDQCHSSTTLQQEKRVLIHGDTQKTDGGVRDDTEATMKKVRTLRKRIGSRPPLCRNKCETCYPCEAVKMVPTPTISSSAMQNIAHLDYSNYNPEGWKCKCGARIFNP